MKKIVRDKATKTVFYCFDNSVSVVLDEASGMTCSMMIAGDMKPSTHEILSDVPDPALWFGGKLKYTSAMVWEVLPGDDEFLAKYNAAMIPESVAKWAAEAVLIDMDHPTNSSKDMLDRVEEVLDAMATGKDKKKARSKWNKDQTIRLNSPTIAAFKSEVPMTQEVINQIFIDAKALEDAE